MPLRPTKKKETYRVLLEVPGPQPKGKFTEFKAALKKLRSAYKAKIADEAVVKKGG